jgi:hypothetical protein
MRLVDGNVLDADAAVVIVHFDDLVDQQERVPVRQQLHDPHDVRTGKSF